jgi:dTDP-4-dehydrorhamnose reductase
VSEGSIVITGYQGLVGTSFAQILAGRPTVCLGSADLDPANPGTVYRHILGLKPTLVINCAADTDVEAAESAPERAFAVNATLAGALAKGAADAGAAFIQLSSTGCYGDWKDTPYIEADPLRPTTAHHRSKAEGEERVMKSHSHPLILRLGWVFGVVEGRRKNFIRARLQEARGRVEIGSNPHQIGCPTPADALAVQALALYDAGKSGVFNVVGEGAPVSRLGYVAAILAAAHSTTKVVPIVFPRRAPVSPNEAAMNEHLDAKEINIMPPWRLALTDVVRAFEA